MGRLEGAILTLLHDAPVQAHRLEGAVVTVLHDAPIQVARLEGAMVTILHQDGAAPPTGGGEKLTGLFLQGAEEGEQLTGLFLQGRGR